jgi:tetratricopeptide (TPR) repeat protein
MRSVVALVSALVVGVAAGALAQTSEAMNRRQAFQHYRNGQELMQAELFEKAEQEFSAAIQLDPLLTLAHYGRGQSFMALKRFASAVQAFVGCREAFSRIFALRQSDTVAVDRRIEEEIRELHQSIGMVRAGRIKGWGEAQVQQLEARLEDLERMRGRRTDRFETPAELSLALGSAYFRNNQPADAEREWKAAVAVNGKLGEAYNNLAALYAMTERKKEAEEAVRAAERARYRVHPQLKDDIRRMK